MKPWAYYNEFAPDAADVLRELIKMGEIMPGEVDERSIEDVSSSDLAGFTQHHFFAGCGVWSLALRKAGWPDSRPVWTGSCPCPPFSSAGKKKLCPECSSKHPLPHAFRTGIFRCTACGHDWYADGRHLWPEFYRLIKEFRPERIYGEQVAGRDGLAWGDIVQATLELEDYTIGRVPFAACGVGAPNIRQRLYWMAHTNLQRCESLAHLQPTRVQRQANAAPESLTESGSGFAGFCGVGDTINKRLEGLAGDGCNGNEPGRHGASAAGSTSETGAACGVDNSIFHGCGQGWKWYHREHDGKQSGAAGENGNPNPTNGYWQNADWLLCRDGFYRPVESITEPLADGFADSLGYSRIDGRWTLDPLKEKAPSRKSRLSIYGNAINLYAAVEFIKASMEA
ncbi:hypothetical protein LJC48_01035 [Desulfovibrio sp. OttesenSCG-928-C06]|nr:hypothetical protein [Desulfovibrio sp. OttesenSCG-928-C06]